MLQERELQIIRAELEEVHSRLSEQQRKARELEEQIQNDDRVERLEAVLKHTQDRSEELEFQLSKLTQVRLRRILCNFVNFRVTGTRKVKERA